MTEKRSLPSYAFEFRAPLLSVLLAMLGSGFFMTFLTLRLKFQGDSDFQIGLLHSAYFSGLFFGALRIEHIVKKVGHIQALAAFGSLGAACIIGQGIWMDFYVWMILRALTGLSLAALYVIFESWMLDRSDPPDRGAVLSLYMMTLYGGQAMSQQLLATMDIWGITPFLVAAFFTSLSVIPVALSTTKLTVPSDEHTVSPWKLIQLSPFGFFGCFAAGLIVSALYSFAAAFGADFDLSGEQIVTATIAGGVILQWPIGKISDYFDRRKTLYFICFVTLIPCIALFFTNSMSPSLIYSLAFVVGGFAFTLYPLSLTQVCDHVSHERITAAMGAMLLVYGVASILSPILSSLLMSSLGGIGLYVYIVCVLGLLIAVGTYSLAERPQVPEDEQTSYVPVPHTTSVAYEMAPHDEENQEL